MLRQRIFVLEGLRPFTLALLACLVLAPATQAAPAAAFAGCDWSVVRRPQYGLARNASLAAVAATSPIDAWAVGSAGGYTLIARWDGVEWTRVPSPNDRDSYSTYLTGIAVDAVTGKAWAVGFGVGSGRNHPLIAEWNGASWELASHPAAELDGDLFGVAVVSSSDVWVVGGGPHTGEPIIEHFDGKAWTLHAPERQEGWLTDVSAVSSTDVWAGGGSEGFEHWDGDQWRTVPGASSEHNPWGLSAVSPDDVWSAGFIHPEPGYRSSMAHWNGTQWERARTPRIEGSSVFRDIAAGPRRAVVVGLRRLGDELAPLIERWSGTQWRTMSVPSLEGSGAELSGVSLVPGSNQAWAVGLVSFSTGKVKPLILRYC